jgi:hypothetical protein
MTFLDFVLLPSSSDWFVIRPILAEFELILFFISVAILGIELRII